MTLRILEVSSGERISINPDAIALVQIDRYPLKVIMVNNQVFYFNMEYYEFLKKIGQISPQLPAY